MMLITRYFTRFLATLALLSTIGHAVAAEATVVPSTGTHPLGAVSHLAAQPPAGFLRPPIIVPISVTIPFPVLSSGPISLYPLQATASSVTVSWFDPSSSVHGFRVFRRDDWGNWQHISQVSASAGTNTYSWVDTSTDISGQCYMVAAYGSTTSYTNEECTVRPDPSQFPQGIPWGLGPADVDGTIWWNGLSDINDGTGPLVNNASPSMGQGQNLGGNVRYADRTFGVNLTFANSSLWRVEAQGGPHLMKGQAVALKVWGGGWLKYGHETFGVDLQLSATPVYQWYVLGGVSGSTPGSPALPADAGDDLTAGTGFALWNSSAQAFLGYGYQTFGISLSWYKPGSGPAPMPAPASGVKTVQVFNCTLNQEPAEVVVKDLTTGGGYMDLGAVDWSANSDGFCPGPGSLPFTFSPQSGHQYALFVTQNALCGDLNPYPQDPLCIDENTSFVGGANGGTEPIVVHGGPPAPGS